MGRSGCRGSCGGFVAAARGAGGGGLFMERWVWKTD